MNYKENKSITNIISSIVVTGVYALIQYNRYSAGAMNDENIFKFWAIIILIFIPISVATRIIILIIFHIGDAVVKTAKGEEVVEEIEDERDKLIQMKASGNSMFIFALGFIIALFTQLFDGSNHLFFITLIGFGFITEIASDLLTIRYYRKGV
jgi:uncharacterized membrane protein